MSKSTNANTPPAQEKGRSGQSGAKDLPARQLRFHEQLAKIDALSVAQIAATLLRDGGEPTEAVRKAYVLLDIAEHCNLSLNREASVEAGIERYQKGVEADDGFYPEWHQSIEEKRNSFLPVDEAMKQCDYKTESGFWSALKRAKAWKTTGDLHPTSEAVDIIEEMDIAETCEKAGYPEEIIEFFREPITPEDIQLLKAHKAAGAAARQETARQKKAGQIEIKKSSRNKRKASA